MCITQMTKAQGTGQQSTYSIYCGLIYQSSFPILLKGDKKIHMFHWGLSCKGS